MKDTIQQLYEDNIIITCKMSFKSYYGDENLFLDECIIIGYSILDNDEPDSLRIQNLTRGFTFDLHSSLLNYYFKITSKVFSEIDDSVEEIKFE